MMNTTKIEQAAQKFTRDITTLIYAEAALAVADAFNALAPKPAPKKPTRGILGRGIRKLSRELAAQPAPVLLIDSRTTIGAVTKAGRTGAKLAEIAGTRNRETVKKELQHLKGTGAVVVRGNTRGARWYLKTQAPKS